VHGKHLPESATEPASGLFRRELQKLFSLPAAPQHAAPAQPVQKKRFYIKRYTDMAE